ncbi:glycoside hydrolase family 43 protein [Aaosphaeria arxii CBS 175.79]|uniref:Glycoside hydrolase family 43 protein n=1 Tax=Aaosphaeria arxii CBS 175.79 TaxID=1450172 RepID=A0A6A5XR60_9PLEO|nr:glycoside hydrolase family 43 protein [Aaosphaeria arxii CBS 175.79]KAF2015423.1 glycoside hydrolase family 43 protein [Aaosphaeria arxii CBS 175.79]
MRKSIVSLLFAAATSFLPQVAGQSTFRNPVIYEDFPDNDIFVGPDDAFYFSASNFHYSPGAPILKSFDLVNWQVIGHSIPKLDFGDRYDLTTNETAYRGGTWASTLRYRKSNKTWYWIGCTNFYNSWVFTAPSVEGPWTKSALIGGGICYYDNGLLIDDDDTMYVVYGNPQVSVAQLAKDGLSQVKSVNVLNATQVGAEWIEGNRFYKINGTYYILNDEPGSTTYIWKSKSPWGPYEAKMLVKNIKTPLEGGSSPHQGSIVQTARGDWYYMSFTWAYPSGRLPVLAPIKWGSDGFPYLVNGTNGGWGESYPMPLPARPLTNWTTTYKFDGNALPPTFEWNHNPDNSKVALKNGLTLSTATVTDDFYRVRNTLTHRIHGEYPSGTVELDFSKMADGDRAGLAAFRDRSSYIGIHRDGDKFTLNAKFNMTMDEYGGPTIDNGQIVGTAEVPKGSKKIWLRTELDARPNGTNDAKFFYSTDGKKFVQLGGTYKLYTGWAFFLGYRHGIFNYATKALGGSIKVLSFTSA